MNPDQEVATPQEPVAPPTATPGGIGNKKRPLPRYNDLKAVAEPFEDYFNKHLGMIKEIQVLMETKLSDHPEALVNQLTEAEKWGTRAKSMEAFANSYLDLAERQRLVPYDRTSWTDTDRAVELAAACARERRFRDICAGLVAGIDRRVSLGQSLLRYHEERLRRGA